MTQTIKVGIVGATGYTGVELLRLLAQHPQVQVAAVTGRGEAGVALADYFPSLRGIYPNLYFQAPDQADLAACDVVFFATPNGVAMQEAPPLLAAGVKVNHSRNPELLPSTSSNLPRWQRPMACVWRPARC